MRVVPLTSLLATLAFLLACGDAGIEPVPDVIAGPAFVNATATALDFEVTGVGALSNVRPSVATAMPAGLASGSYQATVRAAGTSSVIATLAFEIGSTGPTNVIAFANGGGITARALEDTGSFVPQGKSKVRVINLAQGSDIDIWRTQPDWQTGIRFQFPFPFDPEPGPYFQSDAGTWDVWITPTSNAATRLHETGPIVIPSGQRRTIVVVDSAGFLRLRVLTD